ncbi:hypothetical protein Fcan01_00941 [Folsomia candida]|uniref:Uncharacterized protein n=1 Tax=Folsomia candida TaxID=158441 RepID=A0A226EXR9_FOLCA|nr:hypothetical protein Fcan01_00941 [Folsomia candida]
MRLLNFSIFQLLLIYPPQQTTPQTDDLLVATINQLIKDSFSCHVHIVYDSLSLSPFENPATIRHLPGYNTTGWNLQSSPGQFYPGYHVEQRSWLNFEKQLNGSIQINISKTKGIFCIFAIISLKHVTSVWHSLENRVYYPAQTEAFLETQERLLLDPLNEPYSRWWYKQRTSRSLENRYFILVSHLTPLEFKLIQDIPFTVDKHAITVHLNLFLVQLTQSQYPVLRFFVSGPYSRSPYELIPFNEFHLTPHAMSQFHQSVSSIEWISNVGVFTRKQHHGQSLTFRFPYPNYQGFSPFLLMGQTGYPFAQYILFILLQHSNDTLFYCENNGLRCYYNLLKYAGRPNIVVDDDLSHENQGYRYQDVFQHYLTGTNLPVVGSLGYSFLTTWAEQRLRFELYTHPFQLEVWIGLLLTLLWLWGFLRFLGFHILQNEKTFFSSFLCVLSGILDDGGINVPPPVWNSVVFRTVFGLWFLISPIFTNAYVGVAVSDLSAPLPLRSIDTFQDLLHLPCKPISSCLKELGLSFLDFGYGRYLQIRNYSDHRVFGGSKMFRILSSTSSHRSDGGVLRVENVMYYQITTIARVYQNQKASQLASMCKTMRMSSCNFTSIKTTYDEWILTGLLSPVTPLQLFLPVNQTLPQDSAVEKELMVSNEAKSKIAFIDTERKVDLEFEYLTKWYPNEIKVTKSKEIVGVRNLHWNIPNAGGSRLPEMFGYLLQSGIYHVLDKYSTRHEYQVRRNFTKGNISGQRGTFLKPASLRGSIQTIFIIWAALICAAIGIFVGYECIAYHRVNCVKFSYNWFKIFILTVH